MEDKDYLALAAALAPVIKRHVESVSGPLLKRIEELEQRAPVPGPKGDAGASGRDGSDGKDGAPGPQGPAGAKGDPGLNGKDADNAEVARLLVPEVERTVAALPKPKDGERGADGKDGRDGIDGKDGAPGPKGERGEDGKSVTIEDVAPLVREEIAMQLSAWPRPKDGAEGPAGPEGKPGRDGTDGKDGAPGPRGETGPTGATGADGKDGKDGAGLADTLIDDEGRLVLTMTDGRVKTLRQVVGKDGAAGDRGTDGKDGLDGFGFDDLSVEHDGERGFVLKFVRGGHAKEFKFSVPAMINRGVFELGRKYTRGDVVTWAGSAWHCEKDTADKPGGGNDAWVLIVKRGRDGKEPVNLKGPE